MNGKNQMHDAPSGARLIARVVREVIRDERFASLADLTDAVKFECGALRIGYSNDAITDAYRLIASNANLVDDPRLPTPRRGREHPPEPEIVNREQAAAILRRLGVVPREA